MGEDGFFRNDGAEVQGFWRERGEVCRLEMEEKNGGGELSSQMSQMGREGSRGPRLRWTRGRSPSRRLPKALSQIRGDGPSVQRGTWEEGVKTVSKFLAQPGA